MSTILNLENGTALCTSLNKSLSFLFLLLFNLQKQQILFEMETNYQLSTNNGFRWDSFILIPEQKIKYTSSYKEWRVLHMTKLDIDHNVF